MADGFIKPRAVDKAMIAANPLQALVGYLSTVLAVFGVFEAMGLSADQVAILGGALLGIVSTVQHFWEKGKREEAQRLRTDNEELKRRTSQFEASAAELEELRKIRRPAAES